MTVGSGEEVALHLHADVAAGAFVLAYTVADGGELEGGLGVAAETYIERTVGIFKAKAALELAELDAKAVVLLPLYEGVDDARAFVHAGLAVDFHLEFVVEVLIHLAVHIEAHEAGVEAAVGGLSAAVGVTVFLHDVAAELEGGLHLLHDGIGAVDAERVAGCLVVKVGVGGLGMGFVGVVGGSNKGSCCQQKSKKGFITYHRVNLYSPLILGSSRP